MVARRVYDVGDIVNYPDLNDPSCGRTMTVIDREIIQYRTGKYFIRYLCDELLTRLAEDCRRRIEEDYDCLCVIDGKEGSGKSNLAIALCREIDPEWDLESGYIYNYSEFVDAITGEEEDRGRVFLLDEGSLVANKRESMSVDSKRFVELLETMRSRGWILIMCIPSAERLDVYIREHRMKYLLHAHEMAWDEVNKELSRGYFELCFRSERKLGTFRTIAYGKFPKMSPEDKKVYDRLKAESQRRLMDKIAGKTEKRSGNEPTIQKQKRRITIAVGKMRELGMKRQEIADALGCDVTVIKDYITDYNKIKKEEEGYGDGETDET